MKWTDTLSVTVGEDQFEVVAEFEGDATYDPGDRLTPPSWDFDCEALTYSVVGIAEDDLSQDGWLLVDQRINERLNDYISDPNQWPWTHRDQPERDWDEVREGEEDR